LFGTNKLAGLLGTSVAAINFSRRISVRWKAIAPAALVAFVMAFGGAYTVTVIPSNLVRKALPLILLFVAIYTFRKKDLGTIHAPFRKGTREAVVAVIIGGLIGFYDGFFGPGTGSFLVFLFVRFLGFDFLHAAVSAKVVNVACNSAALMWFGYSGHVMWKVGLAMASFNVAGSIFGSRLALRGGSSLVRKMFLFVLCLLIIKTCYDAYSMP
jgi:uncharacterized membrane protein YfcA